MRRIVRSRASTLALGIVLVGVGGGQPASAQTPGDRWEVTLAPYLMGAAMDGTTVVRGREAEVDVSASEVFENLEFGFMSMLAARRGGWGLAGDIVYAALGVTIDTPPADVDPTQVLFTVEGLRRLNDAADLTFGLRWNHLNGRINFKGPLGVEVEQSKNWVDPAVGVGVTERASLEFRMALPRHQLQDRRGNERFEYDVLMHGPALGFAFRF